MKTFFAEKIVNIADKFVGIQAVGLDISDRSIKYLKFTKTGDLEYFGDLSIPEGIIESGEIKKESDLEKVLSAWLAGDGKKLRSSFVAVSLPEEKSFVRLIQLPKVQRNELANAVRWEIEGNIPMPLEELVYDYEAIDPAGPYDHLDVIIVAFPKVLLNSYLNVLKKVGLHPYVLELESQAIIRALLSEMATGEAKIIADIGRTRSSLIIAAGSTIVYTTTINFGGKILEDNLARVLGVGPEEALAIKKDMGIDRKAYEGRLAGALLPALSSLADGIKKAITFYQTHPGHAHGVGSLIKEMLLVGGDSNLLGLETYLSSSLKIPVRVVDARLMFRQKSFRLVPDIAKNKSLGFATAIGLALRGTDNYR
jgi:type IV pilus assembly protein PilM